MKVDIRLGNGERARWALEGLQKLTPTDLTPMLEGLGFRVIIESIHVMRSEKQNKALHWLLKQWMELDRAAILEMCRGDLGDEPKQRQVLEWLKRRVQVVHWGAVPVYDEHGNEHVKPLKTLTGVWDWALVGYRDKQCTKQEFRDLIERVYRLAEPCVLPELKKESERDECSSRPTI